LIQSIAPLLQPGEAGGRLLECCGEHSVSDGVMQMGDWSGP
jgi:hypothetical protein